MITRYTGSRALTTNVAINPESEALLITGATSGAVITMKDGTSCAIAPQASTDSILLPVAATKAVFGAGLCYALN